MSTQIRMTGPAGVSVTIGASADPFRDGYDFVDFPVTIEADGLRVSSLVRTIDTGDYSLRAFFRRLADDWRGQAPRTHWRSLENGLEIIATRDPSGHVSLDVTLRPDHGPGAWSVTAKVSVDAGAEMSGLADTADRLLRAHG